MPETNNDNVVLLLSANEATFARTLLGRIQRLSDTGGQSETAISASRIRELAGRIYAIRRERQKFFEAGLFSDPAWDMLIALFCSEDDLLVTSLIHAAEVPYSTGLRWVRTLENNNLIARRPHNSDRRKVLVSLTSDGRAKVAHFLERATEKHWQPKMAA